MGSCYALGLLGAIFGESSDCGSDGVGVEVEVGDQPQGATCVRDDEYVFSMQAFRETGYPVFRDGGEDHVGLYWGDLDAFDGGESLGEEAGVRVVFGQSVHMVLEGVYARRRQDARLAHAATEHFPPASGLLQEIGGADQD